jgi:aminoglycoside phosphotransferase (APT) family kinase protein
VIRRAGPEPCRCPAVAHSGAPFVLGLAEARGTFTAAGPLPAGPSATPYWQFQAVTSRRRHVPGNHRQTRGSSMRALDGGRVQLDERDVQRLVAAQFPQWRDLPVSPVEVPGWDNQTFRLGESMSVRLPSGERYAAQVRKEQHWLPRLASRLPLPIPTPIALGAPEHGYPWEWSVYGWLPGEPAARTRIPDLAKFATDVARFLRALESIDTREGPEPGPHNFFRGGSLAVYDDETRRAIHALGARIDGPAALRVWERALSASRATAPVWVHGDVAANNLLVRDGRLAAVIDFGSSAVGDPACDLVLFWTFLRGDACARFRDAVSADEETWARARGWALWKALITLAGGGAAPGAENAPQEVVETVLSVPAMKE